MQQRNRNMADLAPARSHRSRDDLDVVGRLHVISLADDSSSTLCHRLLPVPQIGETYGTKARLK